MENEEKVTLESEQEVKEDIKPEYNKAPMWTMRVAGGLIDLCILFLASFGLYNLIRATPAGNVLTNYRNEMIEIQDEYKLDTLVYGSEETYGHKAYEGSEEYTKYEDYLKHTDDNGTYIVVNNETISSEVKNAFNKAVKEDKKFSALRFNYRLIDFAYIGGAGGVSELVFLFAIPMFNKRRMTLGKLLAGTQLVDNKYHNPPKWYQMLGRWLWIYIVESLLVYLIISTWIFLAVPGLSFIIILFNKDRRTIHDFISRTKVIDKRTYRPITEEGD